MKRGRHNVGFSEQTNNTNTPVGNVVNARPMLDLITGITSSKTVDPLWPKLNVKERDYEIARQGELAFTLMKSDLDMAYTSMAALNSTAISSYSDRVDTVPYLTTFNGLGLNSDVSKYGSIDAAQASYRTKIRYLGVVANSIQAEDNLAFHGNTLVVGKSKMTIGNTGNKEISIGDYIYWDVPLTSYYSSYGSQYLRSERDRYPMLTMPLVTEIGDKGSGDVDELHKIFSVSNNVIRNPENLKEISQFWSGIHSLATGILLKESRDILGANGRILAPAQHGAAAGSLHGYAARDVLPAFLKKLLFNFSWLSLDSEELNNYSTRIKNMTTTNLLGPSAILSSREVNLNTNFPASSTNNDALYPFLDNTPLTTYSSTDLQNVVNDIKKYGNIKEPDNNYITNGMAGPSTSDTLYKLLSDINDDVVDSGVYKIVSSVVAISETSPSGRVIGMAGTPASPGKAFDLILK